MNVVSKPTPNVRDGNRSCSWQWLCSSSWRRVVVVALLMSISHRVQALSSSSSRPIPTSSGVAEMRNNQAPSTSQQQPSLLAFVSFDLDDTLFDTSKVVRDANAAMLQRMAELGGSGGGGSGSGATTEYTTPNFVAATRAVRKDLDGPITYSDLRKAAIRRVLFASSSSSLSSLRTLNAAAALPSSSSSSSPSNEHIVEECFDVWLKERHVAAERYLFPHAVAMLQQLRQTFPGVCIAGITNGAGNPLCMPHTLAPHFDFCVSGESPRVFPNRKPHSGIYEKALQEYRQTTVAAASHGNDANNNNKEANKVVWCHVGDCLSNDVGASAACGAHAVWFCPDDNDDEQQASTGTGVGGAKGWYSTASAEEVSAREARAREARSKVAARIACLSELPQALNELLERRDAAPLTKNVDSWTPWDQIIMKQE